MASKYKSILYKPPDKLGLYRLPNHSFSVVEWSVYANRNDLIYEIEITV